MDPATLDLMKANHTNPELAEIIRTSGSAPSLSESADVHALREQLLERKRALTAANPSSNEASFITETDHSIPLRDGQSLTVRSYALRDHPEGRHRPVMVMLHGGGWVLGGLDNEALLCRKWCEDFGGVSVNVDYRLAPEHKFPTAVYDCFDATLWTARHADTIGGRLQDGFIVAGVSAGANMAATIAHLWRDEEKTPPLTGVYLSIPSVLSPAAVPEKYQHLYNSREQNKDAPILSGGTIRLFRKHYEDDPTSPLMSPAIWPSGHKGLPRTYLQIAGMDPLCDEGLIFESMLRESGVETKVDLYPGLPHGFWSWWPTAGFSKIQFQDSLKGFAWLLKSQR